MSFQKLRKDSFCVGGRRRSATTKIYGDITSKCSKVSIGYCSICHRKKSMIVSHKTIQAEGLGVSFKNLGKKRVACIKKDGKNRFKKPRKSS